VSVLDAHAIVAALLGEPAAGTVAELLRGADGTPLMSAANVAEVVDVLGRLRSVPLEIVEQRLGWLIVGGLEIVPVDHAIGALAGSLRARHYQARARPLSLADCLALATALSRGEALATADGPLLDTAADEGCAVHPMPDSSGHVHVRRPGPGS
jgi:PIN domain nuclease of toxin-antitoxin system